MDKTQCKKDNLHVEWEESMINTILFDLDGTLLPMDQDEFVQTYFKELIRTMAKHGCEAEPLSKAIWTGTYAMVENDGSKTNREAFFDTFTSQSSLDTKTYEPIFDAFYLNEFNLVKRILGASYGQKEMITELHEKNYKVILATAPVFPRAAVESRLQWVSLEASDFDYITSYENCHYCKPNVAYYQEILDQAGAAAEECLMIGNNARDDMAAGKLGMETFLLTDYLEKTDSDRVSEFRNGKQEELKAFLKALPVLAY